jgi:adenosylhomocysteine nucleosidase
MEWTRPWIGRSSGFGVTAIADVETLLVVAAEAREFAGLRRHCRGERRLGWPLQFARRAELHGLRVVLVANGAGPALAGEACEVAWMKQKADALVSTGFCGALDAALRIGGVFVASGVDAPDKGLRLEARTPECGRPHSTGRLVSVDRVVQTVEEKKRLRASGALAVEMEAAAVGQRARAWGVPFYCVRSVTDLAEESFQLDFNAARGEDGRFSTARILGAAVRRPRQVVPELCTLYKRSRLASRELGEFLADCRF